MTSNFRVSILDVNISDHQFIHINRIHNSKNKEKLEFIGHSYKNYDYDLFCSNLINLDWNQFYLYNDVNIAWNLLHSRILTTINDMCPLKKFKVAQAKELWVTNEILEMIKDKDRLLRRAKQRNTEIDWELARNARNNTNAHIRRAKANFIQDNLNLHQNNSKTFWQNIEEVLPSGKAGQSTNISFKDQNQNFIQNNKEMANVLNDFFITIGPSLAFNMTDPWVYRGHNFDCTLKGEFSCT